MVAPMPEVSVGRLLSCHAPVQISLKHSGAASLLASSQTLRRVQKSVEKEAYAGEQSTWCNSWVHALARSTVADYHSYAFDYTIYNIHSSTHSYARHEHNIILSCWALENDVALTARMAVTVPTGLWLSLSPLVYGCHCPHWSTELP